MNLKEGPLDWTGENTEVGTITVPVHLQAKAEYERKDRRHDNPE